MGFFNRYPYTDMHEINLDWIIGEIKKLHQDWSDFKVVNSIRFYGEHDITKGYPAWALVSHDNIGYISTQIVPPGVSLDNTDYWKIVANYSELILDIQERVARLEIVYGVRYQNLSQFKNTDSTVDDIIYLRNNAYKIVERVEAAIDDIITIELNSGLFAVINEKLYIDPENSQFANIDYLFDVVPVIYDGGIITTTTPFRPKSGTVIDGLKFETPLNATFGIYNKSNITFKNCEFEIKNANDAIACDGFSYITIDSCKFHGYNCNHAIMLHNGEHFIIRNCTFEHVGGFNITTMRARYGIICNNNFNNELIKKVINVSTPTTEFEIDDSVTPALRYSVRVNDIVVGANYNNHKIILNAPAPGDSIVKIYWSGSLEHINLNSESKFITVSNNNIYGSGDSGIVCGCDYHNGILDPEHITESDCGNNIVISNNVISYALYSAIAFNNAFTNSSISDNNIANCGIAVNADNTFNGGIWIPVNGTSVIGNIIQNIGEDGYMSFGIGYIVRLTNDNNIKLCGNNVINIDTLYNTFTGWQPFCTYLGDMDRDSISYGVIEYDGIPSGAINEFNTSYAYNYASFTKNKLTITPGSYLDISFKRPIHNGLIIKFLVVSDEAPYINIWANPNTIEFNCKKGVNVLKMAIDDYIETPSLRLTNNKGSNIEILNIEFIEVK